MHVRVTNKSDHPGQLLVDDGDHDDDGRPPRVKEIAAGASLVLALTVRGTFTAVGFDAHAEALPRRIQKPEPPPKSKARRRATEV